MTPNINDAAGSLGLSSTIEKYWSSYPNENWKFKILFDYFDYDEDELLDNEGKKILDDEGKEIKVRHYRRDAWKRMELMSRGHLVKEPETRSEKFQRVENKIFKWCQKKIFSRYEPGEPEIKRLFFKLIAKVLRRPFNSFITYNAIKEKGLKWNVSYYTVDMASLSDKELLEKLLFELFWKKSRFPDEETYKEFEIALMNWMSNYVRDHLNKKGLYDPRTKKFKAELFELDAEKFIEVIEWSLWSGVIDHGKARTKVLPYLLEHKESSLWDAIEKTILATAVDDNEILDLIEKVLSENPAKVEEYKKGKTGLASMFMGEVLKKKKGMDPKTVKELLDKKLKSI